MKRNLRQSTLEASKESKERDAARRRVSSVNKPYSRVSQVQDSVISSVGHSVISTYVSQQHNPHLTTATSSTIGSTGSQPRGLQAIEGSPISVYSEASFRNSSEGQTEED